VAKRSLNDEVGKRLLKGLDLASIGTLGFMAGLIGLRNADVATPALLGLFVLTLTFLCVFVLRGLGLYEASIRARLISSLAPSLAVVTIAGIVSSAVAPLFGLHFTSSWNLAWLTAGLAYVTLTRVLMWVATRHSAPNGHHRQRIAIVGGGKAAEDAITTLEQSPGLDIEIIGLFDDRHHRNQPIENILEPSERIPQGYSRSVDCGGGTCLAGAHFGRSCLGSKTGKQRSGFVQTEALRL
jgi:FlaA1/EpsC-like NDP-sugar epimerase